jgi:hypothetical protein
MAHECSHLCSCDSMLDLAAEDVSAQRLERMQSAVATLIRGCGEDLQREGLVDTPRVRRTRPAAPATPVSPLMRGDVRGRPLPAPLLQRVAKAWLDLAGGLQQECQGCAPRRAARAAWGA